MDPEELNNAMAAGAASPAPDASAQPAPESAPAPDADGSDGGAGQDGGDKGPLSKIEIEPAEEGNHIVTHHPKVPERVKHLDAAKPRRHAVKKGELEAHIKKHAKRLKP